MEQKTYSPSKIVFVVVLIISIAQSIDIFLPSMPHLVKVFNTTNNYVQFSMTLAFLAFGLSVFVYGPLSDYFGRKKIVLLGISIFIFGSVVCFFSTNITMFYIGRFLQGIGVGSIGAVAPAMPKDVFTGSQLIKTYSYISMALAITPIIAPTLGGYLQQYIGWKANFAFPMIYASLILIFLIKQLPETNPNIKAHPLTIRSIVKDYFEVISNPKSICYTVFLLAVFSGEMSYLMVIPFIAQKTLGFSPVMNGWLIFITVIGFATGSFLSSRLSKYLSIDKLLAIGLIINVIGASIMLLGTSLNIVNTLAIIGPMVIYMFGSGFVEPNSIAGAMTLFPKKSGVAGSTLSGVQMFVTGLITMYVTYQPDFNQKPLSYLIMTTSIIAIMFFIFLTYTKKRLLIKSID